MNGFASPLTSANIQYVLAFIVVVLAGVIAYQNRLINKLQEGRLSDAKEMNDKVTAPLLGISQTVNLLYDKLRDSKER